MIHPPSFSAYCLIRTTVNRPPIASQIDSMIWQHPPHCAQTRRSVCVPLMLRTSLLHQRIVDNPRRHYSMLVVRGASRMTNQAIPATSLSGPPVSRWFGFFPEFRDDSLGFLLRCHSYGDVVKLPMGRMAEILFRHPDLAMYFLNHPDDVKHVLVTNQHNYTKSRVPPGEARVFGKGVIHTEGETHHHQRRLFL